MSAKSKPKKQHHAQAAEILKETVMRVEEKRQRKLVKEVLYEYLLANSQNIEDAKNICYATNVAVEQAFHNKIAEEQKRLSQEKLTVLEMEKGLVEGAEFERFRGFLKLLEQESVSTATSLLQGLKAVIESFEREEHSTRPLASLKATFLE